MVKTLVLYHALCLDGFTAAWAARAGLEVEWAPGEPAVEYIAVKHGEAPPDVTDARVYVVDFSYPRGVLEEMWRKASFLAVLDHHKTAQADLEGLSFCAFDMERSGAGMTWDYFHGRETRPLLVQYVEDRDLWRFKLPNSKEINAYIGSFEQTFEQWDSLAVTLEANFTGCVSIGAALLRAVDRYVHEMAKQARVVSFAEYAVPVVNAPYINTSELVGHLAESCPAAFAVGWYQGADGQYKYSLRSRGDFDVSALAKRFGGGGHKNAAGFSSPTRVHP